MPLTLGVIDDDAVRAFTQGQCHALALALHERTGWPIRQLENDEGEPFHLYVETPDGRALDITGAHDRDEFRQAWCAAFDEPSTPEMAHKLPATGVWRAPDMGAARAFVAPLLELYERDERVCEACPDIPPPGLDQTEVAGGDTTRP
jgi:hypothetical protein